MIRHFDERYVTIKGSGLLQTQPVRPEFRIRVVKRENGAGTAIRYNLDCSGFKPKFWQDIFLFSTPSHIGPGVHPASCIEPNGAYQLTGGNFAYFILPFTPSR